MLVKMSGGIFLGLAVVLFYLTFLFEECAILEESKRLRRLYWGLTILSPLAIVGMYLGFCFWLWS